MSVLSAFLRAIARGTAGTTTIEAAFIIPILGTLCLGGFECSRIVARNTELQTALAEAASLTLARQPQTQAEMDTIKSIVAVSSGLDPAPAKNEVMMVRRFRCGTDADPLPLNTPPTACPPNSIVSSYLQLTLKDTYTPIWTDFGVGSPVEFTKTRMLQIS